MLIKISLKFVPSSPINNIPALVHIMAWHRPRDKPYTEPMAVSLQWLVDSLHKGPVMQSFDVLFYISLFKLLNKQSKGRWIKMFWWSFDIDVMISLEEALDFSDCLSNCPYFPLLGNVWLLPRSCYRASKLPALPQSYLNSLRPSDANMHQ